MWLKSYLARQSAIGIEISSLAWLPKVEKYWKIYCHYYRKESDSYLYLIIFDVNFWGRFCCYFSLFLFISPILSEFRRWTLHFSIYWQIFSIRRPQSTSSLGFLWISKWNIGFFHKLLQILSPSLYLESIYCHIFVVVITIQIILNRLFNLRG